MLWFNFILGLNCYFPLFWVKVMYDNEFKRKGKKFSQKKDSGLLCSFFCLISPACKKGLTYIPRDDFVRTKISWVH